MHEKFLGDSFDIVKRFLAERLAVIAPLFPHPRFVPNRIRPAFEKMLTMPILQPSEAVTTPFGLYLDPLTGIPLPTTMSQTATIPHAPVGFIVGECDRLNPEYLIGFDQSDDRKSGLTRQQQRDIKRAALRSSGIVSFYYASHAPFLFAATEPRVLDAILRHLIDSGIPASRFECDRVQL